MNSRIFFAVACSGATGVAPQFAANFRADAYIGFTKPQLGGFAWDVARQFFEKIKNRDMKLGKAMERATQNTGFSGEWDIIPATMKQSTLRQLEED